jgi:hypothetical protein
MVFCNCMAAMHCQNAGIVSNAVWNARLVTGVLEMIRTGKGWMEGG